MADKILKGINFPGLPDTYYSPGIWTQIWSNPNPTNGMGEGVFASGLNLSDYSVYLVICRHTTTYGYENSCYIHGMYTGVVSFPAATFQGSALNATHRYFTFSSADGTFTCSNGYNNGSANNSACVPVRIYAAKM